VPNDFDLKETIKEKARQLGFVLAGVTTPEPPPHFSTFEHWLAQKRHGTMEYLATERSRMRRADPREILPGCQSILVLATPYHPPRPTGDREALREQGTGVRAEVAAYAWGKDYHDVLPGRMKELVQFIEEQVGGPVKNRWYTDTGPVLERDLAQRAGLGWIGKNTCLINPKHGSYFLLSEILLDLPLEPDLPMVTDHCGTCARCIEACPTDCILPDRTINATRCISYLTIELKDEVPPELRDKIGNWVFGCDICQVVCPWNRFAGEGDPAFGQSSPVHSLTEELSISAQEFNQRFKGTPIKRAKRRGYLRNVAVALGNTGDLQALPVLQKALNDAEPLVREHTEWAIEKINQRVGRAVQIGQRIYMKNHKGSPLLIATNNKGKIKELHDLLKDTGIELVTPAQIHLDLDVTEDGNTYAENAIKKAVAFAQASGFVSLADDSGLEVDALDGAPGLYSARYGSTNGQKLSDAGRRAFLIQNLQDKPRPWIGRFHATIAIALPNGETHLAEGFCEGEIIPDERGTGGFGYDPIFLLSEQGKTMAELSIEEKNRLSHRARAVMNVKGILNQIIKSN
jgi:epoxyqueuosine reductase